MFPGSEKPRSPDSVHPPVSGSSSIAPHTAGPSPQDAEIARLLSLLRSARRTARVLLVARHALLIAAVLLASATALALVDYLLRLPGAARMVFWFIGMLLAGVSIWKLILPAARFRPTLVDLALHVEQLHPEFKGRLAAAVDFAGESLRTNGAPPKAALSSALARIVIAQSGRLWNERGPRTLRALIRPRPALEAGLWMSLALTVCAALLLASPTLWFIGAQRVATPWTDAAWPKRSAVVDVTSARVHPLGTALPLQAAVTRSRRAYENTDVIVRYRMVSDGQAGPARVELLTYQNRTVETPQAGADSARSGALFERLLEPVGDAIEYRFETEDDRTQWRTISLVEPPAVESASALITPPKYVQNLGGRAERFSEPLAVDLGPGIDERAAAPPSLIGSRVDLRIALNKPASVPPSFRRLLDVPGADASITAEGSEWHVSWTLVESLRMPVELVDEHGIASVDEAVFRFDAEADRAPEATVTEPPADREVLATAHLKLAAEGRDDVALDWVALEQQVFKPAGRPGGEPSGPGGAMDPASEPARVAVIGAEAARTARCEAMLDLSVLGLKPGDEVHVTALASDVYASLDAARQPTRSAPRILRVISEDAFVEAVRGALAEVRQAAIRIAEQQDETRARTLDPEGMGADMNTRRAQAQVSDRIAQQSTAVQRLGESVRENGLNDQSLADILAEAALSLAQAGQASNEASRTLDAAASTPDRPEPSRPGQVPLTEDERRAATDAQEEAREELGRLIEMLDRGEDNWVIRNSIEQLARQQQDVRRETESLGARTAGKNVEQLTPKEQSDLERIVQKQLDLARRMQELLQEMRRREEDLREADPASAMGIADAMRRAQEEQVQQRMEDAAQQAQQNHTTNAGQQQQAAAQALEQMLQDIDSAGRNKEQILRRLIASVIESIKGLIEVQENQLTALAKAQAEALNFAGLDRDMIDLHQNTLGVADLARSQGAALAPVTSLLARAADAQNLAIVALRAAAPDGEVVRGHEQRSLDTLRLALERAEQLDQQLDRREQQRQLEELKRAYRGLLEQQTSLKSRTEPFAGIEDLSRRDRVEVRKLAEQQESIRAAASDLPKSIADLAAARVFDYTHKRFDQIASGAASDLQESRPAQAVAKQTSAVMLLQSLLEALNDPKPDEQPFNEGAQSNGGGGGGAGAGGNEPLIPPLKELRLLRQIQTDLAAKTFELEQTSNPSPAQFEELGRLQRELAEVAEDLVNRMEQPGGAPQGAPSGPDDQPPPGEPGAGDSGQDAQKGGPA